MNRADILVDDSGSNKAHNVTEAEQRSIQPESSDTISEIRSDEVPLNLSAAPVFPAFYLFVHEEGYIYQDLSLNNTVRIITKVGIFISQN